MLPKSRKTSAPVANPSLLLSWSGQTDRGRVRKNNEDAFLGLAVDAHEVRHLGKIGEAGSETADFLFAVSDGMGGANAGDFASRSAVEKITRLLPPLFKQRASGISAGFDDVLDEIFTEIHRAILYLGSSYEECAGMGATLSLCWFTPGWMHFGHIGDSRIYYFPSGGGIKQLTEDDTHVGWLFRTGAITEWEAKNHPMRNMLQKSLGADQQFLNPQLGVVGISPGDRFLICSDGVTDGVYDGQLLEFISGKHGRLSAAEHLVKEAVERSGRDNTTAVIVNVN